ncbi:MAG: hypothetical protein ACRDFX_13085 [Chloroflexota bacterium]
MYRSRHSEGAQLRRGSLDGRRTGSLTNNRWRWNRAVNLLLAALVAAGVLSACGSSRQVVMPAAEIGGNPISRGAVREYAAYATSYYASTYGSQPAPCGPKTVSCTATERQALARLLEEGVVRRYAAAHGLHLGAADRARVDRELTQLQQPGGTAADLLARHAVTVAFLRSILQTEAMVRKVENLVAGNRALMGFQYRLTEVVFPAQRGQAARASKRALDLATNGGAIPADTYVRTEWIAPFRLQADLRTEVAAANPGKWVGPLKRRTGYLVAHVLNRGPHRYGRPARIAMRTSIFREWVKREVQKARPKCYGVSGSGTVCP